MSKKLLLVSIFFISAILFLFSPKLVLAEITINEFSSGTTLDWIEIYNTGTTSAQLSGFRIRDSSSSNKKDLSGELGVDEFQLVTFSNWLNNDGDIVKLVRVAGENEELLEEIPYGSAGGLCTSTGSESIGRLPDGSSNLVRFATQTQNASNNTAEEDPCPVPTPTPTPTPTSEPTNIPTPTPSPTLKPPTSTPTPKLPVSTSTPTPKQTATPSLTPKPTSKTASESGEVLGGETATFSSFYSYEATEGAEENEDISSVKNKLWPKIFLICGLLILFASALWLWYTFKE